jgi:hypothetical protein
MQTILTIAITLLLLTATNILYWYIIGKATNRGEEDDSDWKNEDLDEMDRKSNNK